jgi:hypothetical protein
MAQDNPGQTLGLPRSARNDRGGVPADSGPYIGVVMDNKDATRTGRVRVWLKSHSADDKKNPAHWRVVRYLSPFFGYTPHDLLTEAESNFENNSHAYGMWATAPDLGVEVLCFFVDGDPNKGYYIGYVPQPQMNHMVPGTGAQPNPSGVIFNNATQESAFANASQLPTVEMDRSKEGIEDSKFVERPKPVHSVVAAQMWQAGTITDNTRGPITSSAQRESPSYTYGISTPGRPILQSGLTEATIKSALGNISTKDLVVQGRRGGHSFIMDDGTLEGKDVLMRLRTSTGHQILLSDDGAVIHIMHANGQTWIELGNEGTVDVYAANSINLRSQGEVNIHADKNINMHSEQDIRFYAKRDIKMESDSEFSIIGKQKLTSYSEKAIEVKSDGTLKTQSAAKTSIKAGENIVQEGKEIRLNCEAADVTKKPALIEKNNFFDTVFELPTGWVAKPVMLKTITSRAPSHEPYAYHNQGVPVKVKLEGPTPPPPAPPKTAAKVEAAAEKPVVNPVTTAEVVKQGQALGEVKEIAGMGKQEVVSMIAQQAKNVSQPLDAITDKGIGKFGIKAETLESLGLIKPGLADLKQLSAAQLQSFLDDASVFTGKDGINSLQDILTSEKLQGTIVQNGMEFAFNELKATGILTGLEKVQDMAGILNGAMNASPGDLVDWVKGKASGAINEVLDVAANAGQFAANLAEKAGDLINNSLSGVQAIAASASKSIHDLVGTVERANVDAAVDNLISNAKIPSFATVSKTIQSQIKLASGEVIGAIDAAGNLVDAAGNIAVSAQNITNNLTGTLENLTGNLAGSLDNLTGNLIGNVTGNLTDITNSLTGSLTDLTGNLGNITDLTSSLSGGLTGITGSLSGGLTGITGSAGNVFGSSEVGNLPVDSSKLLGTTVSVSDVYSPGGESITQSEPAVAWADRSAPADGCYCSNRKYSNKAECNANGHTWICNNGQDKYYYDGQTWLASQGYNNTTFRDPSKKPLTKPKNSKTFSWASEL